MSQLLLNTSAIRLRSQVNGPGLRSVVWVQGCSIGCPGCFNPHTHLHKARRLLDPVQLGHQLAGFPDTDGITISGGEPFEQAEACSALAETVRAAGRSVMVFTGYRYKQLKESSSPMVQRFLATIDLLVAGPYVKELNADGRLWRASTNQALHFLTDRLVEAVKSTANDTPLVEIALDGRTLISTGFPDDQDRKWLTELSRPP